MGRREGLEGVTPSNSHFVSRRDGAFGRSLRHRPTAGGRYSLRGGKAHRWSQYTVSSEDVMGVQGVMTPCFIPSFLGA